MVSMRAADPQRVPVHTAVLAPNESYIKRERRVLHLGKERDVHLLRAKELRRVKEGTAPIFPLDAKEAPNSGGASSSACAAAAAPATTLPHRAPEGAEVVQAEDDVVAPRAREIPEMPSTK